MAALRPPLPLAIIEDVGDVHVCGGAEEDVDFVVCVVGALVVFAASRSTTSFDIFAPADSFADVGSELPVFTAVLSALGVPGADLADASCDIAIGSLSADADTARGACESG